MTEEQILLISESNLEKSQRKYNGNYNRKGVTQNERDNLTKNVEYAKIILDIVKKSIKGSDPNTV